MRLHFTSTDFGPRSTKSPRNRKSAFGGWPATSNTRSRSANCPCRSPTTLMGAWSRSNMGSRRNARRASAHRARMQGPLHRPGAPSRSFTMSPLVQCFRHVIHDVAVVFAELVITARRRIQYYVMYL